MGGEGTEAPKVDKVVAVAVVVGAMEVAVEMCNKHRPPASTIAGVEIRRIYVKDVLSMAASIIIAQGDGLRRRDRVERTKYETAEEKASRRLAKSKEIVAQRAVRRSYMATDLARPVACGVRCGRL